MRKFTYPAVVLLLFILSLLSFQQVKAQFNFEVIQATSDDEVIAWVDTIFLAGVDPQAISSITFSGDYKSFGRFTGGFFLGFSTPEGIVMTSGHAGDVDEANICNSAANANIDNNGVEGDPDLYKAAGNTASHDGCIVEFNFKPTADTVRFNYVFASEEYHDYVTESFNDVFGFFLSANNGDSLGPYTNDAKNIAIIPATNLPVSIHNVNFGNGETTCSGKPNGCVNCQYLKDNSQSTNPNFNYFVYDALTTSLTAKSAVQKCNLYHIKLAVGDAGDQSFDSGVLLEKGSFNSGTVVEDTEFDHPTIDSLLYESCNGHVAVLYFRITEPIGFPYTFPFEVGGTATRGTDYLLQSTTGVDSIYIPVGSLYDSLIVIPFSDNDPEGTEEVRIIFSPQMCNSPDTEKDTSIVVISDNPPFNDTIRYYTTKCEDTLYLTFDDIAGGVPPYTHNWYENNSTDPVLQYIISGSDSTMVPCIMTDTCGFLFPNKAYVLVPDVQVTAGPDKEMYNESSVTLEGASDEAQYFFWNSNPTDPSLSGQENIPQPTVSPTTTTEYVLRASDNCTHTAYDTAFVLMNEAVANATSDKNETCLGDSVVISVNDAATYSWTADPPDPSLAGQDTNQTIIVYPQQSTTYSISLINNSGNHANDEITITVNPLPNADAGMDGEVCKGLSFQLNASGGNEYKWSSDPFDSSLFTDGQDTLPNPNVTPDGQTTYTYIVMVTDNNGCVAEDSMKLFVKPVSVADVISTKDTICYGEPTTINAIGSGIDATWVANPPDPSLAGQENYLSINVLPDTTTTYTLSAVATGFDCPATITKTIEVYDSPTASFEANPEETVLEEATIDFTNLSSSTDSLTYTWDFNDGSTSNARNPQHTYQETGVYEVSLMVITEHECQDTYLYEITVHPDFAVFVPNAFSPNGDGLNDTFKVKGVGVKDYLLQIYSRWGKLVFETTNLENEWDAANVPGGTYVFVIHATTLLNKPIEEKGSVTVVK